MNLTAVRIFVKDVVEAKEMNCSLYKRRQNPPLPQPNGAGRSR
jgi:hypothetical protein